MGGFGIKLVGCVVEIDRAHGEAMASNAGYPGTRIGDRFGSKGTEQRGDSLVLKRLGLLFLKVRSIVSMELCCGLPTKTPASCGFRTFLSPSNGPMMSFRLDRISSSDQLKSAKQTRTLSLQRFVDLARIPDITTET